ncbi:MAG: class A beta-lactamase-related serine hydrolase [Acidobacteriota bacterium]|nr:class A beta-lactamase-related serine hydrolase [Acidobacteriota bacterium]
MHHRSSLSTALVATFFAAALLPTPVGAVDVLDYCLDHPDQCSLSVHAVTDGWERHLNPDRLHVTASTFKILTLIVYAQAIVDGEIDAERLVAKEDWARFWIGRDGGALARSWEELGSADQVTVDQMMRMMIQESDNASPDWLLHELGSKYFEKVLGRYVDGYHDVPMSIAGSFVSWEGNPDEAEVGRRVLAEYSGADALGYQKEVGFWFRRLGDDEEFTRATRRLTCSNPPWEDPDPGCGGFVGGTTAETRRLHGGYFVQSNSRTYNRLLLGILDETLLPAAVQEVVVRHLEWQLEIPEAAALATRLGTKGGSLSTQNVCNFVAYVELVGTNERLVASVFLQDVPIHLSCEDDIQPFGLLEGLVLEDGFKKELMERLPEEEPHPELIARLETLKRKTRAKGDQLKTKIRVRNIGPVDAEGPFEVWLVVSDDAKVTRKDTALERWVVPFLETDGDRVLKFKRKKLESLEGKYLFVRVDRKKEVAESGEDNDRPWQRLD